MNDYEVESRKPFWRCEECGYVDDKKPMPINRKVFYEAVDRTGEGFVCRECKSRTMMPVGF